MCLGFVMWIYGVIEYGEDIFRVCFGLVEAMGMIGAWSVFVWGMVGK